VLLRPRLRSLVLRSPSPCSFRARRPVRKFSSGTIQPHDHLGLLHEESHLLGRPLAEDLTGVIVGAVPRQRAVKAHGVLEVREAVRAEAPGVFARVAGGLVFVDGASARGSRLP
jgi:hypothetical protein